MDKGLIKKAFINTFPVMAGYITLGFGFGVILKSAGYGIIWAFLMSLLIYAGAMQYLMVSLITATTPLFTVAVTTLLVNARHLFYGISMIEKYKRSGGFKPYLIFALTDETYSLLCNSKENNRKYFFLVSLFDQVYWITGSCLGALVGSLVSFNSEGIDFALTALFITVFTEQWLSTKNHFSAIIGVCASVISVIIFGSDNFLIPAMIAITIILIGKKHFGEDKNVK